MLRQLRETKHGAPYTDDADVPEELRKSAAPPTEHEWDTDDNHFKRWDWILDEMIFSFEKEVAQVSKSNASNAGFSMFFSMSFFLAKFSASAIFTQFFFQNKMGATPAIAEERPFLNI